jgi:hypothetical protein
MVGGAFMLQSKEEPTNSAEVMTPSTRRLIHWVDMTKVQVDGEGTLAHPLENVAQVARQRLRQSLPIAISVLEPAKDAPGRETPASHGGINRAEDFGEAELRTQSSGRAETGEF